ncbi:hypothetical protein F7D95_03390 [Prevotella copri]|uniref:Stabilization protein n=1 Tax=Segatella copri TaxID=165179 RepID=A0AA90ZKT1_9BACT|nr:hypothetical protein [Segatella copri]MQN11883.1 hypothetical protein [Segatella copri]
MERNLDRKTLSFSKGMTNVPSDLLSEDSELAYSQNIIYRNGEMVPIQKMKPFGTVGGTILFVHKMADFENIITYDKYVGDSGENKYTIRCYKKSDLNAPIGEFEGEGEVKDAQAVGNTLVLATDNGLRYILYESDTYKDLGMNIPNLKCNFTFEKPTNNYIPEESERTLMNISNDVDGPDAWKCYYDANGKFLHAAGDEPSGIFQQGTYHHFSIKVSTDGSHEKGFQETVQGHVAQAINWVKSKNMFAFPFFVRCAFRLFDGSYTKITTPYICYPTINRNCRFSSATFDRTHNTYMDLRQMTGKESIFYFIEYSELKFKFEPISNDWRDIIKEIVVFASDQVLPFRLDSGWKLVSPNDTYMKPSANFGYDKYRELPFNYDKQAMASHTITVHSEIQPEYKTDQEIIDELLTKSQFYKLFSVKASDKVMDGNWHYSVNGIKDGDRTFIAKGVVENLTTQTQLNVDDYYGWAKATAERLYTYNGRLQAIGLLRYPFGGFSNFTGRDLTGDDYYYMYTHIVTNTSDTWTMNVASVNKSFLRGWIYYPDPNATEIILYSGEKYLRIPLIIHPMLNGSYSFTNLPSAEGDAEFESITEDEMIELVKNLNQPEYLDSQIFTSVVNNPFVFEASGDNTVGTGKILGIVANTEAVSQGQFGQYPLLVFTDEGIYAMSVNAEGLYSSIHPISREVCNNADSITPTDKVVYFTSEKGLMATSGGEAICVSGQLSGGKNRGLPSDFLPFKTFLENCLIAYDYKASLLRIFNKKTSYHYVYNMVDKIFSISHNYTSSKIFCRTVANNYPDNLVQFDDSSVYSLTNIPLAEDDANDYDCVMTTRPLKLGGSTILKSLRGLKHLLDSDAGTVSVTVYGSNNGKDWIALKSLFGKPWKYFKLEYSFKNFKASDSFAGSIIETQSRREDKIR